MDTFQEQASRAIYEAGGRMTPQRWLLINLLEHTDHKLDAEGLYALARQQDSHISLTTVYRTLNALENAGLLQQRYLSQEHDRKYYEPLHAETEYHFTCRNCKRVLPFRSPLLTVLQKELEIELGVEIANACVCFSGLCPDCKKGEK